MPIWELAFLMQSFEKFKKTADCYSNHAEISWPEWGQLDGFAKKSCNFAKIIQWFEKLVLNIQWFQLFWFWLWNSFLGTFKSEKRSHDLFSKLAQRFILFFLTQQKTKSKQIFKIQCPFQHLMTWWNDMIHR